MAFERFADWKKSLSYPGRVDSGASVQPVYLDFQFVRPVVSQPYVAHRENRFEWLFPVSGVYRCCLDGAELAVRPGETLLIQPGERHQDWLDPEASYFSCHFKLDGAARLFRPGTPPAAHRAAIGNRDFADRTIALLWSEACFLSVENYPVQSALFLALFRKILADYPPEILSEEFLRSAGGRVTAGRILAVFDAACRADPPLDELARRCGMSRSALGRATLEIFGQSPRRAFLRHKLHRAAQFLADHPERNCAETAAEFGFPNPFHFSRVFRREFGCSPREYRKIG